MDFESWLHFLNPAPCQCTSWKAIGDRSNTWSPAIHKRDLDCTPASDFSLLQCDYCKYGSMPGRKTMGTSLLHCYYHWWAQEPRLRVGQDRLSYSAISMNMHRRRWYIGWDMLGYSTCLHTQKPRLGEGLVEVIWGCPNWATAPTGICEDWICGKLG